MFLLPNIRARRFRRWHAWLFVAILLAAGVLAAAKLLRNRNSEQADVPAMTWVDLLDLPSGVTEEPVDEPTEVPSEEPVDEPVEESPGDSAVTESGAETTGDLPAEFNLALPFTSQAPFANWDAVHEETCEEASILMVIEYFAGNTSARLDPTYADNEMLKMVAYEESIGYGVSITAAQTEYVIENFYDGYSATVVDNPTVDTIKQYVADGYPVIIPAAGRELGNPNFTGEGPLYHMLVVRGWTADGRFITNDPGTRLGENYTYTYDVLMEALGDWEGGNPPEGPKRIIVIKP